MFRQAVVSISSLLSLSSISKPCLHLLPDGTESQMLTRKLNLHSPSSLIGAGIKTAGVFSFIPQWKSEVILRVVFFADIFFTRIQPLSYSKRLLCFGIWESHYLCYSRSLTYLMELSALSKYPQHSGYFSMSRPLTKKAPLLPHRAAPVSKPSQGSGGILLLTAISYNSQLTRVNATVCIS